MQEQDRETLKAEIARIDSQLSTLSELKRQYLVKLAASTEYTQAGPGTQQFTPEEKIALFRGLFRGREDIYARRWENRAGKSGYSPACKHEWDRLLCRKPAMKCSECGNRELLRLDESVVGRHLDGQLTAGIYPLLGNDACYFLAMDFDGDSWTKDIAAIRETCAMEKIPAAVERSRSGNGGHVWIFFSEEVPASLARRLGTGLISKTMTRYCQLEVKSYDRLFPNQDTMPQGGFGNLIALPLQKAARQAGNSVFIDESGTPYADQWSCLASTKKLSRGEAETIVGELESTGGKIPARWTPLEDEDEPWSRPPSGKKRFNVNTEDLPASVEAVLSNRVYIKTASLPSALINQLKHLAAFHNPDFYKKQKQRFSTHATPRIICCAELDAGWLSLPRGCLEDIRATLADYGVKLTVEEKRFPGTELATRFLGTLNTVQQTALKDILAADFGILSAPPGSGKTVMAIAVLAARKRNTLIIVHRKPLMQQWRLQLSSLLGIDKKEIGLIGGGKDQATGRIDIAMVSSLEREEGADDRVAEYGLVIMDECHHAAAVSFEKVLNQAKAKYILGLTATPYRRDGHQPIVHMQCGPIVHRVKDKDSLACAPNSKVIARRTDFAAEWNDNSKIYELWPKVTADEHRNALILKDICDVLDAGRFPLILTERREHLAIFESLLKDKLDHLAVLYGGMRQKRRREVFEELKNFPDNCRKAILATGSYIGEGFDEPRLDTLLLTMPASFKGRIVQYAGRLHRRHADKTNVVIYDYVDAGVPVLANMHRKRLKTYKMLGYTVVAEGEQFLPGI